MTTGKTIVLTRWTFVNKVMSLLFNMLSRLVIAFLPRSKCLLISWLHSPSVAILKPKKIKSVTVSIVSPFICHEVMGLDAMIFVFWILSSKPAFALSSFTFIRRIFSSSLLLPQVWCHLHIWVKSLSRVQLFVTPWPIQSMEFSRSEYWSGWSFPSLGIFPNQGSNPGLPHCRQRF